MEGANIKQFLIVLLERRTINSNQLAKVIGVSHATIHRWFNGEDIPSPKSCGKLADFSGVPQHHILYLAGHIKHDIVERDKLPLFREFMEQKYPGILSDDLVDVLEQLINRKTKGG